MKLVHSPRARWLLNARSIRKVRSDECRTARYQQLRSAGSGFASSDCVDNAMCESFFATLECELLERCRFKTQAEARMATFDFIESWYNPHRRHSALDYHSSINYERIQQEIRRAASGGRWPARRRDNPVTCSSP